LIVRWPAGIAAHQVREELVSTVDLMPTFLEAAGAEPVKGLPGRSLLAMSSGEPVEWRRYLFTEYHTHAAGENFYPQRAVRSERFKLIESLLPGQVNPGYAFTVEKLPEADIPAAVEAAPSEVREAYALMRQPPQFELYDLESDPYEFRNLAQDPEYAQTLSDLQRELEEWREETRDPLLNRAVLQRLKDEVESVPTKKKAREHEWAYPDYFFETNATERKTP
jgi:N-sulfoglucosamine sulfohydrolase